MGKTAVIWNEKFLLHDTGPGHPEKPARLQAIHEVLQGYEKTLSWLTPVLGDRDDIARIHTEAHIQQVESTQQRLQSYLDPDTVTSQKSWEAALFAVGSTIDGCQRVLDGEFDHAFAFVRPPGHHAETDHAMGFCLFNNIAIAAAHLAASQHLKKIAIIDFDVHHGNGTQHSFYDRSDVFYVSTHQYPFYPGTGAANEKGTGAGAGHTLNLPMTAGAGDEEYKIAFQNKIIPTLQAYQPEIILVSAGYDAHRLDPLANINLTQEGFYSIVAMIHKLALDCCQGKQVYVLEGGYSLEGLQEGVKATLRVLTEKNN